MWRCYFSMLGLVAYLHFVMSLNASTSMLLSHQKGTQGTSRCGNNVSTPLAVSPVSPSPTAYSASSIHNDGNRNVTQSEAADSGVGGTGLEGALSLPLRMANETTHQDSATIERDDGSQQLELSQRPSTIQNCPAEPHICSHDDCGGNVSSLESFHFPHLIICHSLKRSISVPLISATFADRVSLSSHFVIPNPRCI